MSTAICKLVICKLVKSVRYLHGNVYIHYVFIERRSAMSDVLTSGKYMSFQKCPVNLSDATLPPVVLPPLFLLSDCLPPAPNVEHPSIAHHPPPSPSVPLRGQSLSSWNSPDTCLGYHSPGHGPRRTKRCSPRLPLKAWYILRRMKAFL